MKTIKDVNKNITTILFVIEKKLNSLKIQQGNG